jgi:peroxiredoxin
LFTAFPIRRRTATYFGHERTTFVIGPDRRVAGVLRKVKPAVHDELVLKALDALEPQAR